MNMKNIWDIPLTVDFVEKLTFNQIKNMSRKVSIDI